VNVPDGIIEQIVARHTELGRQVAADMAESRQRAYCVHHQLSPAEYFSRMQELATVLHLMGVDPPHQMPPWEARARAAGKRAEEAWQEIGDAVCDHG
jgi:hypothetical protein